MSEKDEDTDFAEYAEKMIRKPRKGTSEQLLCAKLVSANRVDALKRVKFIAEACWFAEQQSGDADIDLELAETLYSVATALDSVERDKRWSDSYTFYFLYPVPWSFKDNRENFERYIKPWLKSFPKCYTALVTSVDTYRVYKTRVLCSQCKKVLLDIPREDKSKHKELVKEKFKDSLKFENKRLISKGDYEKTQEFVWRVRLDHLTYHPPFMKRLFFKCPKCEKQLVLSKEVYHGSHRLAFGYKMRSETNPNEVELEVEDYDFLNPDWKWHVFFESSQYLSRTGYKQLVNSFVSWADPIATQIESKISTLVSPRTFMRFYRAAERKEEEKDEDRVGEG